MENCKKVFVLLLCLCMIVFSMSGCNKEFKKATDVTTVTMWSLNSHSKVVMTKIINDFNNTEGKEKGINIKYLIKPGNELENLVEVALHNGNAPDFLGVSFSQEYMEKGYLLAIDDLPGGKEYLEKYKTDPNQNENIRSDGKTYCVYVSAATQGMVYNKDMFRAAGIVDANGVPTPPETFDEMRDYAKRLTNKKKQEYGIVLPMAWRGWFASDIIDPAMRSCGYELVNPKTKRRDYTTIKKIAQYYLDMKADGSVLPGSLSMENDPARARFAEGGIGMKMAFNFDVGVYNDQFVAKHDWGVAPHPLIDKNIQFKSRMSTGGTSVMNANSLYTVGGEKMMEVLKFITSDDNIRNLYKEGVSIPYNLNIVKDVQLGEKSKTGWKEFCDILEISALGNADYGNGYFKENPISEVFINDVWVDGKNLDEVFDAHEKFANDKIDQYYIKNSVNDIN